CQDADDRHDDHQFDEGETLLNPLHVCSCERKGVIELAKVQVHCLCQPPELILCVCFDRRTDANGHKAVFYSPSHPNTTDTKRQKSSDAARQHSSMTC